MSPVIELPNLPEWAQQLVGVLPLTALIEFIEEAVKLHIFELAGLTALWSWPISPKGARLVLSTEDTTEACYLDRPGAVPMLHCMDAKYSDHYPSAAAATVRLFLRNPEIAIEVENSFTVSEDRTRQQKLDVYIVGDETSESQLSPIRRFINMLWGPVSLRFALVSACGWALWTAGISCSILSGTYYGMVYLLLMPISGYSISQLFGNAPRSLLSWRDDGDKAERLVVVTDSLNGRDWTAFLGPRSLVNALLNRPLQRSSFPERPDLYRWVLRLSIIGQWTLVVLTTTLQNWDAAMVTFWTLFCSFSTTYLYPSENAASDWLRYHCRIKLRRIRTNFGSRRSLLGALVYINPDREATEWMNPILAKCEQRTQWEKALLECISSGYMIPETEGEYWTKFVKEGILVGKNIMDAILQQQQHILPQEEC